MTVDRGAASRRQFLASLGIGAFSLALGGCRSAVNQAASSRDAKPRSGGTLEAGIADDLIPGNIMTNSTAGITTVVGLVYESLIRYPNDEVKPTPLLATSWELSADGLSLTLELRDDVKFHTGRPFTSADVEFSIRTYADPVWNGQLKSTAAAVSRFDTTDPHRVVLYFDHPLGNIYDLLDTVPIIDKETVDEIGTGAGFVGTGPFAFESWTPNSELVFAKNPHYYVPDRPYLDGVRYTVMPDNSAMVSAIKSGQINLANGVSFRDIEALEEQPGFGAITLSGAEQQIYIGANVAADPLGDVRLRQAIAYALDRERVMNEVYRGSGYAVNLPWPKHSLAFDEKKNATYQRDVSKAEGIVGDGFGELDAIPLTYRTGSPPIDATAQIVASNLAEVGIPVELDPVDQAQFVKRLIGAEFKGLWIATHSWAQYTPSTLTVSAYPFNAHDNASHFESARYRENADAAWKVRNGDGANALGAYDRLSEDLLDNLFLVEIGVILPQWVKSGRLYDVSYTKRAEVNLANACLA